MQCKHKLVIQCCCCSYIYPTIDELASQLMFVLSHFGLKSVIGFGVGAGANILARFALNNPEKVFISLYICIMIKSAKQLMNWLGRCSLPYQLHIDAIGLDRVGLPELQRTLSTHEGHDPGRRRLSDVASLWTQSRGAKSRSRPVVQVTLWACRQPDQSGDAHQLVHPSYRFADRTHAIRIATGSGNA